MIDKAFDRVTRFIEIVLALAFILAVMLNFTNVIGRYLFGFALLGSDELQVFVMVAMTFLGAAVVTRRNGTCEWTSWSNSCPNRCALRCGSRNRSFWSFSPACLVAILFLCRGRCFRSAEPATWPACRCGSLTALSRWDLR